MELLTKLAKWVLPTIGTLLLGLYVAASQEYFHVPGRMLVGPKPEVHFQLGNGSVMSRAGHVIYRGPVGAEHPFTYIGSVEVRRDEAGELVDCSDPQDCQSFTTFQIGCMREVGDGSFISCEELAPRLVFKSSVSGVFAASMSPDGHWMIAEMSDHPTAEQLQAMPGIPGSRDSSAIYWKGESLYFARWDEEQSRVVYRTIVMSPEKFYGSKR